MEQTFPHCFRFQTGFRALSSKLLTKQTVWFIGVPSGRLDLLSLKALTLIKNCKSCFYSSSLISSDVLSLCASAGLVKDVLNDSIEDVLYMLLTSVESGGITVKLYSGSLFVYSGLQELTFQLNFVGIPFEVVPSVGTLEVAFAQLGCEFFTPWSRTLVVTKVTKRSTDCRKLTCLETLSRAVPMLVLYLSVRLSAYVASVLTGEYGKFCPVLCVYRATWNEETYLLTKLSSLSADVRALSTQRTVVMIIGRSLLNFRTYRSTVGRGR
ncbi:MAG: SAM-dependent methyltransferase [Candidatus Hodgkinia cicadicola]